MNAIVVVDKNWAIGREGKLLFSLSADMKRFRSLTMGGTVLMGRKTLESLPGGRPLSGRRNIALSSHILEVDGIETARTPNAMRQAAASDDPSRVFVIGGGSIYAALLPYCKRAFLTKVDTAAENPDTFFPNLDKLPNWKVERYDGDPITEGGLTFRFVDYINNNI